MSWAVGYDSDWRRWIGYGVPAYCDHPQCKEEIDRGLAYVCCNQEPYGGEDGCGLYFCEAHRDWQGKCPRCAAYKEPYKRIAPEHPKWIAHLLTDKSWAQWRKENRAEVHRLKALKSLAPHLRKTLSLTASLSEPPVLSSHDRTTE